MPKLEFRSDRSFLIVQLTDVHWHDGGPEDLSSRDLIESVLDVERPDLVALTGDIVGGDASRDPAEALRQAVAPIESRGIPWAMVFGNHDDEGALSRLELLRVQQEHPGCLTERGPEGLSGVGNYVVRIGSSGEAALAAALYFLDSGSYAAPGLGQYAWIQHDQIAWHRHQARALADEYARTAGVSSAADRLPSLAFFHIPLPEFAHAWGVDPCRGSMLEAVCCPAVNSGYFAALLETGVSGAFVGHDHLNDFECEHLGIRLCYGRASGYSSYGREDFQRGARVIRLQQGVRGFETWLHLADGTRLDQAVASPADAS